MKLPKHKACLAPMAGITDIAFRSLCVKHGASMTVTELISAKGLLQNNSRSGELAKKAKNEKFFAIQLFGSDPQSMSQAAELIDGQSNSIDINAGCPVPKVMKTGGGSSLLKDPQLLAKIISKMSNSTNTPISVKIRTGISQKTINAVEVARACEDAGVELITVHGRTQNQGYQGKADWNIIKNVKDAVNILVIGNGDITTGEDAVDKVSTTGVDAVSVGRGASGNPLLFSQITNAFKGKPISLPSKEERLKVFEEYISLAQTHNIHFRHQLLQAQHFTKGIEGAAKTRSRLVGAKTGEELRAILKELIIKE